MSITSEQAKEIIDTVQDQRSMLGTLTHTYLWDKTSPEEQAVLTAIMQRQERLIRRIEEMCA